jgi:hypothetical protein
MANRKACWAAASPPISTSLHCQRPDQAAAQQALRIARRRIRPDHGDGAREAHDLRGAAGPCPCVLQDAAGSRRNVLAIDAQMRCRGDGEALAGTVGTPQAEILIEPFGDKPEIDAFERRLQRDLDLSLLDFELDQL